MEAKEKARELVDKMLAVYDIDNIAIDCALIAVDEILESKPSFPIEGEGGYFYEDIELSTEWWKKVKQEIEKL